MGTLSQHEAVPSTTTPVDERLRLVINTIPCLILSAKPDGFFDLINQHWLEFTGLKLEDVCGWGWRAALHPADAAKALSDWRAALLTGEPFEHCDPSLTPPSTKSQGGGIPARN